MDVCLDVNEEYAAAWKDLKRRWWLCVFLFLGYVPIGGGIGGAVSTLFKSEIPFAIIGIAWFISVPVSWVYLLSFRCPRCRKLFGGIKGSKSRCGHCGLPAGTLHDPGNLAEDMAAIKAQRKRSLKKGLLIGIPVYLFLLAAIAVATMIGQKLIAKPRKVAEQFLQQVQAHQYQQAHKLLTPQRQSQLKIQTLQQQWQTFEKAHGKFTKPKWAGGGWPTKSVTLYYEIPDNKGGAGGAKIDMVRNEDVWQIEGVTFYQKKADMFPVKPTPIPSHD